MQRLVLSALIGFIAVTLRSETARLVAQGVGGGVVHYEEAKLSQPTHKIRMEHNVRIPMRDGVILSADIYRPAGDGKFPAILVRTPYNNNTVGAVEQSKWFAERGYVVVQQDVRRSV